MKYRCSVKSNGPVLKNVDGLNYAVSNNNPAMIESKRKACRKCEKFRYAIKSKWGTHIEYEFKLHYC